MEKKNKISGHELKAAIEAACDDLFYISETDAPIRAILVTDATEMTLSYVVAELTKSPAEEADQFPATDVFEKLTRKRDWHTARDKERVRRFEVLRDLLKNNLKDLSYFRSGKTKVEILVLGFDAEGNIAGIRTMAVET